MTFPTSGFRRSSNPSLSPRLRRIVLGVLAAGFFAVVVVPWLAGFATDWLWYNEIRFESVFLTSLIARALLFVAATSVAAFADGGAAYPPPLPLYRRPLAYLTQNDSIFPHLTVAQNVCFGLDGAVHNGAGKWVKELRHRLDLNAVWDTPATRVSGGQARRVALARMLARHSPVVLIVRSIGVRAISSARRGRTSRSSRGAT